jgi:16S rRNA (adenine1518-N6/adenine1519-N6)-dimethyltransferase
VTKAKTPGHRPRKRFGQHFLEPAWVDKVLRAIDPKPDETFIEIGAGRGALTIPLAQRAKAVAAYEIDRDLAAMLQAEAPANVLVIPKDFLSPDAYLGFDTMPVLRVAGNLPYNVASPVLFRLIGMHTASEPRGSPLVDATVMVQREVADRLVAQPGTREYGVLSVLIRHSSRVERLLNLPPGAFRPVPNVFSSLVRLRFHPPDPAVRSHRIFAILVQAVFTRRRKTLSNALLACWHQGMLSNVTPSEALDRAGLDGRRRPETLSIAEFGRLADVYADAFVKHGDTGRR